MPKVKKSTFRAQYKTFGLTYSQCPLEKKEIMDFIMTKVEVEEYYVVRETHKDGNFHIHLWMSLVNKPNIKNCKYFDYKGHHCNIGKKNRSWVHNYLKKQDKDPYTNIPDGYIELAKGGKLSEALLLFQQLHPKEYVINKIRVDSNLRSLARPPRLDKIFPLKTDIKLEDHWDQTTSLWIVGDTRLGKTEYVKSYIHNVWKKSFFRVTHIDGLKKYSGEDYIIYDDLSFNHVPTATGIHLTETVNARDIHCRHAVASIPPGVKNIFLSNGHDIWPTDPHGAINARIKKWAPSIRFY